MGASNKKNKNNLYITKYVSPWKLKKVQKLDKKCMVCSIPITKPQNLLSEIYFCQSCYKNHIDELKVAYNEVEADPDDMNEILPNIVLGSQIGAKCLDKMKKIGITNVLMVGYMLFVYFPKNFEYKCIEINDKIEEDILPIFIPCINYIDKNVKTFVHCSQGKSRSSSVVIAYVMLKKQINYEEAFNFVKSKRDCISPNSGFVAQLKEFEEILKVFNYNENLLNYAQKILFMPNDL